MKTAESSPKAAPAKVNAPFFGKEAAQDFFVPGASGPVVQKKADTPAPAAAPAPAPAAAPAPKAAPSLETRLSSNRGRGEALPDDTMEEMESSLRADLSKVRIHQDDSAVQMSNELSAQAFTHGSDIYFNKGKYDTGSSAGQPISFIRRRMYASSCAGSTRRWTSPVGSTSSTSPTGRQSSSGPSLSSLISP